MVRWRASFALLLLYSTAVTALYSARRKEELRELTRDTWYHAFKAYRRVAYPLDEILPLSCKAQGRDRRNRENVSVNDVMGDYALTLVDGLDTFAILNDRAGFEAGVRDIIAVVNFDLDSRVQTFEVVIRMLGGLLSGHQLAEPTSRHGFGLSWYNGELLVLARDLGRRLLPAFQTQSGIPFARVHLQNGVRRSETTETCTAGAGSLFLEFATLSRLTGDPVYEAVARKAYYAIWNLRSPLDLVGNTITIDGKWQHLVSSTGAGIDSFFEYAVKSYILLGEDEWLRVWDDAYMAIQRYIRAPDGFWYRGVHMNSGVLATVIVDSLSAFFPGVQVLIGDLESAIKAHSVYAFQWLRYSGLPETFDINQKRAVSLGYPLRPEFIESNLFLYRATKDEHYLSLAERVLHDINNRTRVDCGLAAVLNLQTGELEDKQPSFVISETLKYLFLTFDENNKFNTDDSNVVFTTEGHMLQVDARPVPGRRRKTNRTLAPSCPVYNPFARNTFSHFLTPGIAMRNDAEHSRYLVGYEILDEAAEIREGRWSPNGFCKIPVLEDYNIELLFGEKEDFAPKKSKLWQDSTGTTHVAKIENLRFSLKRSVGETFVVSRVGPLKVPFGGVVLVSDPIVLAAVQQATPTRSSKVSLRIDSGGKTALRLQALSATFGPSLSSTAAPADSFAINRPALPLYLSIVPHHFGCEPHQDYDAINGKVIILRRGHCSFAQKSNLGALGGAKAIIVINTAEEKETEIVPSADAEDLNGIPLVPLLLVSNSTGIALEKLLQEEGEVKVVVEPRWDEEIEPMLLGGYLVLNVRMKR